VLKLLGVSRSGYYSYKSRVKSKQAIKREKVKQEIKKEYEESHSIYGAPKIHEKLKQRGINVSARTVGVYMKQMGIKAHYRPKKTKTTINSDFSKTLVDLVNREFKPSRPNNIWVTDITYIWTKYDGFVYLTTVMDLFSRKIIAWDLSYTLEAESVVKCIKQAKKTRILDKPLIVHSDRGIQYVSKAYKTLFESNMTASYSRKGNPWDNAVIESFFAIIKREWLSKFKILNYYHANALIFEYIETFYNTIRIHKSIGYKTPIEYEKGFKLSETARLSLKS